MFQNPTRVFPRVFLRLFIPSYGLALFRSLLVYCRVFPLAKFLAEGCRFLTQTIEGMYAYFSLSIIDFPLPYLPNGRKFLRLACRLKFAAFYDCYLVVYLLSYLCLSALFVSAFRAIGVGGISASRGRRFFPLLPCSSYLFFPVFSLFVYQVRSHMKKTMQNSRPHSQKKAPHKFAALFAVKVNRAF